MIDSGRGGAGLLLMSPPSSHEQQHHHKGYPLHCHNHLLELADPSSFQKNLQPPLFYQAANPANHNNSAAMAAAPAIVNMADGGGGVESATKSLMGCKRVSSAAAIVHDRGGPTTMLAGSKVKDKDDKAALIRAIQQHQQWTTTTNSMGLRPLNNPRSPARAAAVREAMRERERERRHLDNLNYWKRECPAVVPVPDASTADLAGAGHMPFNNNSSGKSSGISSAGKSSTNSSRKSIATAASVFVAEKDDGVGMVYEGVNGMDSHQQQQQVLLHQFQHTQRGGGAGSHRHHNTQGPTTAGTKAISGRNSSLHRGVGKAKNQEKSADSPHHHQSRYNTRSSSRASLAALVTAADMMTAEVGNTNGVTAAAEQLLLNSTTAVKASGQPPVTGKVPPFPIIPSDTDNRVEYAVEEAEVKFARKLSPIHNSPQFHLMNHGGNTAGMGGNCDNLPYYHHQQQQHHYVQHLQQNGGDLMGGETQLPLSPPPSHCRPGTCIEDGGPAVGATCIKSPLLVNQHRSGHVQAQQLQQQATLAHFFPVHQKSAIHGMTPTPQALQRHHTQCHQQIINSAGFTTHCHHHNQQHTAGEQRGHPHHHDDHYILGGGQQPPLACHHHHQQFTAEHIVHHYHHHQQPNTFGMGAATATTNGCNYYAGGEFTHVHAAPPPQPQPPASMFGCGENNEHCGQGGCCPLAFQQHHQQLMVHGHMGAAGGVKLWPVENGENACPLVRSAFALWGCGCEKKGCRAKLPSPLSFSPLHPLELEAKNCKARDMTMGRKVAEMGVEDEDEELIFAIDI